MSLHTSLAAACGDMAGLADYLDHLDTATRLREVRSLGKRNQVKLFEAASGARWRKPWSTQKAAGPCACLTAPWYGSSLRRTTSPWSMCGARPCAMVD